MDYTLRNDLVEYPKDKITLEADTKAFSVMRFKPSGKYYDEAVLVVPDTIPIYRLCEFLRGLIGGPDTYFADWCDYLIQPIGEHDFPAFLHVATKDNE